MFKFMTDFGGSSNLCRELTIPGRDPEPLLYRWWDRPSQRPAPPPAPPRRSSRRWGRRRRSSWHSRWWSPHWAAGNVRWDAPLQVSPPQHRVFPGGFSEQNMNDTKGRNHPNSKLVLDCNSDVLDHRSLKLLRDLFFTRWSTVWHHTAINSYLTGL